MFKDLKPRKIEQAPKLCLLIGTIKPAKGV